MNSNDENVNPPSNWVIVTLATDIEDETYRLRYGVNSIGRHSASDLRIDSVLVSRHHAEITVPEDGNSPIEIKDLNSINGTYINNKVYRAVTAILRENDVIGFGAESESDDDPLLPIYILKFKRLKNTTGLDSPIAEIVISDDEDLCDQVDMKPSIVPLAPEKIAVSNVLTIFGNADDTILDGLQRINPSVCEAVKKTSNAELVVLSSDDDEEKEHLKNETKNQTLNTPAVNVVSKPLPKSPNCFEEPEQIHFLDDHSCDSESKESNADENQLMYSQVLLDEMKSEMLDEGEESDYQSYEEETGFSSKKPKAPSPIIVSLVDDDDYNSGDHSDDFDEDLEMKVSNWTNLLLNSQIYPKTNCSQSIIADDLSDKDSVNDEPKNVSHREDSIIESLFKPLEEKLDISCERVNKRTFEEEQTRDHSDVLDSPIFKKKKRKVMHIDSEESDKSEEESSSNLNHMEYTSTNEPSCTKPNEVKNKSATAIKPKIRQLPIVVSPPHLKIGRRKSVTISPNVNITEFLEKKRKKKSDPKLKDIRKERLKAISAEKNKINYEIPETTKAKQQTEENKQEHKVKAKVKNTVHNRGAFLCDIDTSSLKNKSKPATPPLLPSNVTNPTEKYMNTQKDVPLNFFSQEPSSLNKCLQEVKKVIRKNAELARARSAPKKLRFVDVEKGYEEQNKTEHLKQTKLSRTSTLTPSTTEAGSVLHADSSNSLSTDESVTTRKKTKKTVRFKEEPTIYYFESECHFSRKVDRKDLMPRLTYRHRRNLIRRTFPTINRTDEIISLILEYCKEWLAKKSLSATAYSAPENLSSIPNTFESFEQYKRIVFSLMKLEFLSTLERDMETNSKKKPWPSQLEDIINNKERVLLVMKCNRNGTELFYRKYDLVLLKIGELQTKVFAYMVSCRKIGTPGDRFNSKVFLEILPNSINIEYLRQSKSIIIQSAVDNLQVTIGAYNAMHQMEATPLYEMLLNPTLLLNPSNILTTELDQDIAAEVTNNSLNNEQLHAINQIYKKICLNKTETTPNISLIQGPPGTGKSVVVTNLALQIIYGLGEKYRDKKVLICAQSNCAIDLVAAKLLEARWKIKDKKRRFTLARFGIFEKMHPKVHPVSLNNVLEFERVKKLKNDRNAPFTDVPTWKNYLQKLDEELKVLNLEGNRSSEMQAKIAAKKREIDTLHSSYKNALSAEEEHTICKNYLGQCHIICTTLSSCVKLFYLVDYFDVCIIDEATQCTEPWTLLPLKFGISSLVLVGDSQQLPATVLSKLAAEYGLTRSLFTRIENCIIDDIRDISDIHRSNVIFGLRMQYRMHPEICKFPNAFFYKMQLINAEITLKNITPLMPYSVLSLDYSQNTSSCQGKIINHLEADFVVELLKALHELVPIDKHSYGVITPYAHQRKVLTEAVHNAHLPYVTVNTIDSYQGVEKDVIVISNTRTNGVGFLANPQRLNVAITRPKKCLILCGNFRNLQSVPAWRCLLKDAQNRNLYHEIGALDLSDIKAKVISKILVKK